LGRWLNLTWEAALSLIIRS
jgi:hypothetical protein